jgi:hypothetical protein
VAWMHTSYIHAQARFVCGLSRSTKVQPADDGRWEGMSSSAAGGSDGSVARRGLPGGKRVPFKILDASYSSTSDSEIVTHFEMDCSDSKKL